MRLPVNTFLRVPSYPLVLNPDFPTTMKKPLICLWIAFALLSLPACLQGRFEWEDESDRELVSAFYDSLGREPGYYELERYRSYMTADNWTLDDVRRDIELRNRERVRPDYVLTFSEREQWINWAFEDELGRAPTQKERMDYGKLLWGDGLSRREFRRRIRSDFSEQLDRFDRGSNRRGERSGREGSGEYGWKDRESGRGSDRDSDGWDDRGSRRWDDREDNWDDTQEPLDDTYLVDEKVRWVDGAEVERIIRKAYRDILSREPDDTGMRAYRRRMLDEGWSEQRLRNHLSESIEARGPELKRMVIRAYEDLLDRQPSQSEIDHYVQVAYSDKWEEKKLRKMIRESREYQYDRPHQMIKKAYNEVLLREPDGTAFEGLRKQIAKNDWDYERVKKHLRESPEYRTRTVPELVKKAYREVLGREPDPQGFEAYRKQMLQQDMSYEALVSRLRDSDEYRNRNKSKP